MRNAFARFLNPTAKVLLPNPNEALDLGYASHCADDPALAGTYTQQIAIKAIKDHLTIEAEPNSPESAYLACVRGIILSHARGLTRRKQSWIKELGFADQERKAQLDRINESRKSSSLVSAAWTVLNPLVLALSGYLAGKVIALVIPVTIAAQTGKNLPAILMGLVFILIGRAITYWNFDQQRNKIDQAYRSRCRHADLSYELGKRVEHKLYRERLCEAWEEYTGEKFPETASYEMVMAGDIATRQGLERQLQIYDRTSIWMLRRIFKMLRRKKSRAATTPIAAPPSAATES